MAEALNLINAICRNKDIYHVLSEDSEVFGEYGPAFESLRNYYNQYRSVPSIEILQKDNPDLEAVEVDGDTKFYLTKAKEEFVQGQMNNLLLKAGKHLNSGQPAMTVLDGLQKQVAKLSRLSCIVQDLDIMDIEAAKEHYAKVREVADENGGVVGIKTGFEGIDSAYTTGMAPGHLIYAMGFSGNGKSWFVGELAKQAWKSNVKPMIVSMEMTPDAMRNRIYALMGEGQFLDSELGRGYYDEDNMGRFEQYVKDKPGFVVVSGTAGQDITPNVIQAKIDQHHPGLVVVDYQQLMMDNEKNQSITPRMTSLSRELKLLAVNNNIPIVVISSVTDNDQGRNKPPTIDQIAWGRAMEFSADMVFAVHKIADDIIEIVGRKNRFGSLWDMFLRVDLNRGIFREIFENPNNDEPTD